MFLLPFSSSSHPFRPITGDAKEENVEEVRNDVRRSEDEVDHAANTVLRSPSPSPVRVDPYSPERGEGNSGDYYYDTWEVPTTFNPKFRRTLKLQYWDRTQECKERKWDHMVS